MLLEMISLILLGIIGIGVFIYIIILLKSFFNKKKPIQNKTRFITSIALFVAAIAAFIPLFMQVKKDIELQYNPIQVYASINNYSDLIDEGYAIDGSEYRRWNLLDNEEYEYVVPEERYKDRRVGNGDLCSEIWSPSSGSTILKYLLKNVSAVDYQLSGLSFNAKNIVVDTTPVLETSVFADGDDIMLEIGNAGWGAATGVEVLITSMSIDLEQYIGTESFYIELPNIDPGIIYTVPIILNVTADDELWCYPSDYYLAEFNYIDRDKLDFAAYISYNESNSPNSN